MLPYLGGEGTLLRGVVGVQFLVLWEFLRHLPQKVEFQLFRLE